MSTKKSIQLFTLLAASLLATACGSKSESTQSSSTSSSQVTAKSSNKTAKSSTAASSKASTGNSSTSTEQSRSSATQATSSPSSENKGVGNVQSETKSVSPDVVVGQWKNIQTEGMIQINADGSLADSSFTISSVEKGPDGQLTLGVGSVNGGGFVIYYYPAGVPIPLQLVKTVGDKQVIEPIADPTDVSRERIYSSNGIHLQVTQDQYDDFLEMVSYRP